MYLNFRKTPCRFGRQGVLSCKLYNTSGASTGTYAAGRLHVVKTTDEDNHVSYTFTDKLGRTVLERRVDGTEYLDTYSVYDDFGNLVLVLQPEYQTTADLSLYAFRYEYDHRNLCVKKTLPGAGYISYTYNEGEQMTFSQDGNQRDNGKYTYYLYDKYGRMTEQGECTSTAYANKVVHILNHYDDYSFIGTTGFTNAFYTSGDTNGKGSLTGQTVTVFGSDDKVYIAHYYDIKGRVTKKVQSNLLGGYDVTTTTYTFTGNPATVTHEHTASGKTARTEVYTYTYDHADRLSTVKHKLGSGTEVTLASYTYDKFGRMATKKLHGSSTNQLTYAYNIRNWLTGISSTKFTQTLGYGSDYNGNISSMNWNANGESHSYTFTYDGVNRMLNATHGTGAYTEKVTSYDKNGNIKALQRYGNGLIDDLSYTYNGNQLTRVDDATGNTAGFSNGASTTNEYVYDNNGNLTKDSNKNISSIAYNVLNLPSTVTFSDGSTITYSYAANGTKLRTVHTISGTTTTKDYCANVVYENGIQKFLLTEEGYVDLSVTSPAYYYYLKDHQGNNRVVLSSGGTVVETNHYYPFGGVFASIGNVQPYKYNGKEFDTKKGLNWYDYGARHYDATLGRWFVMDPLSEKMSAWSPYAYCFNNPVRFIDPNGMAASPIYDRDGNLLGTDDEGLQGNAIVMNKEDFKQGMSHSEALSKSTTISSVNAAAKMALSYASLKFRPDYDGKLTLLEANNWYRNGNGQPLFVALENINLNGVLSLGEKYVGDIKSVNLLIHSKSLNDGLVYGQITLKRYPNHQVRAYSDKYNFEMHDWSNPFNWGRNIETIIGEKIAGKGKSYEINIYGSRTLKPILPWVK